eukprot:5220981-Amphidinium_carterae.1
MNGGLHALAADVVFRFWLCQPQKAALASIESSKRTSQHDLGPNNLKPPLLQHRAVGALRVLYGDVDKAKGCASSSICSVDLHCDELAADFGKRRVRPC